MKTHHEYSGNRRTGKLTALFLGAMIGSFNAYSTAFADDTEVFFGQVNSNTNVNTNVMFVLDTSGSMDDTDRGYSGSRLERMKSAVNTILDNSSNVNVGLMRLNGQNGGGAVLYPITGINEQVCASNECGEVSVTKQVQTNDDDMEQYVSSGEMTPNGIHLSLGESGTQSQLVSFRFQELNIPSGVQITSAELEFTADADSEGYADLTISGHDTADAPTIDSVDNYLSTRPQTDAEVRWQPADWSTDEEYQSPDIKNIVQEIVNHPEWCGGQSMAFIVEGSGERSAYAYTSENASKAPILRITYDSSTIPELQGCTTKAILSQINSRNDDAHEKQDGGAISIDDSVKIAQTVTTSRTGGGRGRGRGTRVTTIDPVITRLRFRDLAIPTGATIESATIEFEVETQRDGALEVTLQAEDVDSAPTLVADSKWISERDLIAGPVVWNITESDDWPANAKVTTPDLAAQVQSIVNRAGWQMNNDIAIIINPTDSSSNYRQFESYDSKNSAAAKLRVVYKANLGAVDQQDEPFTTARDEMKTIVDNLKADGGTPIVAAYYEAVQYMLGHAVDYGTERGRDQYKHRYHRVSHPSSYTGGTVSVDSRCTSANPESSNCTDETITGNPVYKSPLAGSCQTNHIVFLSDGDATSNTAISKVKSLTGATSCASSTDYEECGVELASWLNNTDHNQNISRQQNISTYTIGFNIDSNFLSDLATAGGGSYYDAASSDELVSVFQSILGEVLEVDTSFVAPGSTVSQFNRLTHRNDIYFALFKPDARPTWTGNLKRYYVGADSTGNVLIQDVNENPAVDGETGTFLETAQSWWSDSADGEVVALGGAANQITLEGPGDETERRVFTYMEDSIPANGVDLTASAQKLHESNTRITASALGLASGSSSDNATRRTELLMWTRGVDVKDEDLDGDDDDVRQHMGDPMHSSPTLITYKEAGESKSTIFVATNEGMLHAIEHENGTELFAFMPKELLPNINEFYENQQSTKHLYGLDGSLTLWHDDINNNAAVDAGDTAHLYLGMRRGGNHYYAFDVSDRLNPKLLWQIDGGLGDFERLGQTWSRPTPTSITYNGQPTRVLIFGGGYDTNQDPSTTNLTASQTADSIGNAIYIVNAETGAKLWPVAGEPGVDELLASMEYSIPADIRIIDVDGDSLADQMYVGDMGGQLWRFDFQPFHQSTQQLVYGGVMAKLNGSSATDARRLYNEPDVALVAGHGRNFLSVSFGSGWRAHPLNESVDDRFYMLRSNSVYSRPDGYGKNTGTEASPTWEPVGENDLVNVTNELDPVLNDFGWMLELEGVGEKVTGKSVTVNNQVIFTSYEPTASGDACSAAIGSGSIYVLDIATGAPTLDLDGSDASDIDTDETDETDESEESENQVSYQNNTLTKEDRKKGLKQDGIPPAPSALIVDTDGNIGTTILAGTEQLDVDFDNLTQRTYWQDNGRGKLRPDQITAESEEP